MKVYLYMHKYISTHIPDTKMVKAVGLNAVAKSFRLVFEMLRSHMAGKEEVSMFVRTLSVIIWTFLVLAIWLGH